MISRALAWLRLPKQTSEPASISEPLDPNEPIPWRTPQRLAPWMGLGLECPTAEWTHQPHPAPWWSGESVFAAAGQKYKQPEGPFFHAVFPRKEIIPLLQVGDILTSPAERRSIPSHLADAMAEDGCIAYRNYDVHAVYMSTYRWPAQLLYYEVEPEGLLWPDPETGVDTAWCATRARIISVHTPEDAEPYWA